MHIPFFIKHIVIGVHEYSTAGLVDLFVECLNYVGGILTSRLSQEPGGGEL